MKPAPRFQPSPTQLAWLFVEATRPSTLPDAYVSANSGAKSPGTGGGSPIGSDQVKSPV